MSSAKCDGLWGSVYFHDSSILRNILWYSGVEGVVPSYSRRSIDEGYIGYVGTVGIPDNGRPCPGGDAPQGAASHYPALGTTAFCGAVPYKKRPEGGCVLCRRPGLWTVETFAGGVRGKVGEHEKR